MDVKQYVFWGSFPLLFGLGVGFMMSPCCSYKASRTNRSPVSYSMHGSKRFGQVARRLRAQEEPLPSNGGSETGASNQGRWTSQLVLFLLGGTKEGCPGAMIHGQMTLNTRFTVLTQFEEEGRKAVCHRQPSLRCRKGPLDRRTCFVVGWSNRSAAALCSC